MCGYEKNHLLPPGEQTGVWGFLYAPVDGSEEMVWRGKEV